MEYFFLVCILIKYKVFYEDLSMEFSMNVEEKDLDLCKLIANEYVEDKNKVFVSSVGVCAFRNYLADCNIELDNTASLFRTQSESSCNAASSFRT